MFEDREPVMSPTFVRRIEEKNETKFETSVAAGLWYRVIPKTAKEIFYLQTLTKYVHILAPASGHGVLVRSDIIPC